MPATNHTANFNFPLYQPNDHFSVTGDWNNSMNTLDLELGRAKDSATSAARDAASALTSAKAANDAAQTAKDATANALSTAAAAKVNSDNLTAEFKRVEEKANRADSNSTNAVATANTARGEAEKAQTVAEQARQNADSAMSLASGLDSQIGNANAQAASAKDAVKKVDRLNSVRRTVTNSADLGTTSGTTGFTKTLCEQHNAFINGDVIMCAFMARAGAVNGIYGARVEVTSPSGQVTTLPAALAQDSAVTVGGTVAYTVREDGDHWFRLKGGPINSGASVTWATGPQTLTIF